MDYWTLLVVSFFVLFFTSSHTTYAISESPVDIVNLFIGTTNGGHVFPGATLPHGMVKAGMDTDSPGNHAGYDGNATFNATGFSQLHDSGTGGAIPLSNFKIWPIPECSSFEKCATSIESRKTLRKILSDGTFEAYYHASEYYIRVKLLDLDPFILSTPKSTGLPDDAASPGYFSSNLSTNVRVELTSTRRTALHRYTFPSSVREPRIVVDITNDGQMSSTDPVMDIDPTNGRVTGGASFAASFGPGRYRAFTCVDFQAPGNPTEFGVWLGDFPVKNITSFDQIYSGFVNEMGALLTFPPGNASSSFTTILVRVGVSFISSAQACENAESEIPDFDFEGVRSENRATWSELLDRVQIEQGQADMETVVLFYSSLYRTHISPADYTDENPRWNSTEPYYDSLYCNWDTYRTLYSLMALHDPENFARIVRGMVNIQQHEGWLPECRGATAQHFIQGGSNGDPILSEFIVKFHDQATALNVSETDVYNALIADAESQPPNWNLQGRQANIWKSLNYIPQDLFEAGGAPTKQVSRTLEHAFGDFAISQVSKVLGKSDDGTKYAQRAGNFINVWNPNITVPGGPGVKGMMQPRFLNGTFNFTDPRHCSVNDPAQATCFLNAANRDGFYESSPIVYSQYVPQDNAKLIDLQGGNDEFISRLNFIFDQNYFDATDEPSQQIPFMYHYGNRPGLSTQRSRQVIAQFFNTSRNGLPGNDDSGAMGSYAAFYLAGLYPLPATRQVLLSSPYFPQISFFNPIFNKTATIKANGFKGNPTDGTGGTVFVQSVKVDGRAWKSNCFLDWDVFTNGSTVELELTDDINVSCGSGKDALPPSLSTGGYDTVN